MKKALFTIFFAAIILMASVHAAPRHYKEVVDEQDLVQKSTNDIVDHRHCTKVELCVTNTELFTKCFQICIIGDATLHTQALKDAFIDQVMLEES